MQIQAAATQAAPSPANPDAAQLAHWRAGPLLHLSYGGYPNRGFEMDGAALRTQGNTRLVRIGYARRLDEAVRAAQELAAIIQRRTEFDTPVGGGNRSIHYRGVQPLLAVLQSRTGAYYVTLVGRATNDHHLPWLATGYAFWDDDYTGPRTVPVLQSFTATDASVKAIATTDRWATVPAAS